MPLPDELLSLARAQAGVVSREQCLGLGLTPWVLRRLLAEGSWSRLGPGVYQVAPTEPPWLALAWAGVLLGGDRSVLTGQAAGHLYGWIVAPPYPISVAVARDHRTRMGWPWRFARPRNHITGRGSPPRTLVERTVLDLIAADPDRAADWVTVAVNARSTTVPRLRRAVATAPRVPRRAELVDLLGDVGQGAMSPLELLYLRQVERAHGLPVGRRQVRSDRYITDVYYDDGLIVELDGRLGHSGSGRFRDMRRDNSHTVRGAMTLRFGWDDCRHDSCTAADQVAGVLHTLGWRGLPTRCRRCRLVA